jgi:hypothetical protein
MNHHLVSQTVFAGFVVYFFQVVSVKLWHDYLPAAAAAHLQPNAKRLIKHGIVRL